MSRLARIASPLALLFAATAVATPTRAQEVRGYFRFPAVHGSTVVFVAEGDLWKVPVTGGTAQRLTTHPSEETRPAISPDGSTIAFSAEYEGPREVYSMPIGGGLPRRHTYDGGGADVVGWTPDGRILYATTKYSTLPNTQLIAIDPRTDRKERLPLEQASEGSFAEDSRTLFFTRLAKQGSFTRNYKGGTAQNLWRITLPTMGTGLAGGVTSSVFAWFGDDGVRGTLGTSLATSPSSAPRRDPRLLAMAEDGPAPTGEGMDGEAVPLTAAYVGTSRSPMYFNGRVYFISDRADASAAGGVTALPGKPPGIFDGGVMNVWSMSAAGGDLRQHTHHMEYEVQSPSLHGGRVVYQNGADLWTVEVPGGEPRKVPITLVSDFDHLREQWVDSPMAYLTSMHLSPTGDRVVLTARGQVFVQPVGAGRRVEATRGKFVRYRGATFAPDGNSLITLSDESGEVEAWRLPANGIGEREQLTRDADILRWEAIPSPDGKRIAHHDKNGRLRVYDVATSADRLVAESGRGFGSFAWSPDSRWLSWSQTDPNLINRVRLYDIESARTIDLTTDRYDSYSATWSPDGKWLWFLSDRHFRSSVFSPWGARQPDPHFEKQTKIYAVALVADARFPFDPANELRPRTDGQTSTSTETETKAETEAESETKRAVDVRIDVEGLERRLYEVPVEAGNYSRLSTDGKRLYWMSREAGAQGQKLMSMAIGDEDAKAAPVIDNLSAYELSADGKKILIRRGDDLFVFNAGPKAPEELAKSKVDLTGWRFPVDPKEEWRQLFLDAWRLERDYFYDPGMHGVEWRAMLDKYMPLAERATDRAELNDAIAQMVAELATLHIFVRGGDMRRGDDDIAPASLGAVLHEDESAGGWRVAHIYRGDPDIPEELSPLARPGVDVKEGDVITSIDGTPTLAVEDPAVLLRDRAGKQVRLRVRPASPSPPAGSPPNQRSDGARGTSIAELDVIVTPVTQAREFDLRYDEWEYSRRLLTDELGEGKIGYVHLRAMGANDIAQWVREFYPVFNRQGLIIDVRHNNGGNIDSWILGKLLRQAWFYWQPRVGEPIWNMQYAFRGPMVVLVDERTASDGEAFAEGFRRLGLGKVIGTRTWGGEIWLSANNFLADRGIATAAETGVYGPEGEWLIEGWGVEPDIVVDNLPFATFEGGDAQLEAAVQHLSAEIAKGGVDIPEAPEYRRRR